MAKIEELIIGRDGVIRVAKVKTSRGVLIRPVQRLYALEMSPDEGTRLSNVTEHGNSKEQSEDDKSHTSFGNKQVIPTTSRSGRKIVTPVRYQD
jgi:hypothetical protein